MVWLRAGCGGLSPRDAVLSVDPVQSNDQFTTPASRRHGQARGARSLNVIVTSGVCPRAKACNLVAMIGAAGRWASPGWLDRQRRPCGEVARALAEKWRGCPIAVYAGIRDASERGRRTPQASVPYANPLCASRSRGLKIVRRPTHGRSKASTISQTTSGASPRRHLRIFLCRTADRCGVRRGCRRAPAHRPFPQ
jgi:hypothetical protein